MPNRGALTIKTYPRDLVRLACPKCGRSGQYRRQTLLARYGAAALMPDVLTCLANCPRRGNYSDPCQAVYPDLASLGCPDVVQNSPSCPPETH